MAITVVKYPQGHIVDTEAVTATVSSSSGALFTKVAHGLSTGSWIYVYSSYAQYNGYWYVSKVSNDTFRIREYATASDVSFYNTATVTYYVSTINHGWNCVHLPMIYKFKSDTWPINGVDTSRTITTFTNWNGYTYLVLNGDIKATGTASTLENVILSGVTGVNGTTITGVYRIIQWFSDTNVVIDLAYNAGHVLSGGTCQYYYLNYHAKVKVYAGLTGTHYWASVKPYVLLSTEKVTFDSTGVGQLNVADIVKSKIEIFSNNLQLDTLPNNLDAWCQVYISVAESYDDSDMYTISEYTGSYTDDTTAVYAVNARLPFKTRSSGTLDAYVSGLTSLTLANFLTPFTQPTLFDGYYFDLSFIKNSLYSNDYLKIDRYTKSNGNYTLASSTLATLTDYDQGVYRYSLSRSSTESRIDVTYYSTDFGYPLQLSNTITIDVNSECNAYKTTNLYLTWLNYLGGYDYWLFTPQKQFKVDITESKTQEVNIHNNWPKSYGEFAQSMTQQSVRSSKNVVKLTSQYLTKDQADALAWIVSSPLVQILSTTSGVTTARTVIVDSGTLSKYQDRDNLYSVSFSITYTDELPVQTL
jgi:hypothetical protein